jgi:hypothetical protein
VADIYEIRAQWTGVSGSPYYTTLRGLSGGSTTPQEMSDAFDTFLGNSASLIDDTLVCVISPEVRIIDSADGETQSVSTITTNTATFTGTGDPLPPFVQGVIRLQTGVFLSGRRLKGKIYIPGMLESNNTAAGLPSAGFVSGLETTWNTFLSTVGSDYVIYSPTHRAFGSVTGGAVGGEWSILRSRRD